MVKRFVVFVSFVWVMVLGVMSVAAQSGAFPPAPIINDEGGAVVITGQMAYTNPFLTAGVAYPMVILEDQAGFIDRNQGFLFPAESQTLGQFTSDFFTSPVSYSVALPIEPQGTLRDVDNDAQTDSGVMVFAVAYWDNVWGDPFLEERDMQGGGWSTAYASTRVSSNPDTPREVIGGKLLVYAPDDQQGFPSEFGADGLLFTGDEAIVGLPQGYTVVDLDANPFTFDRARRQVIDLIEPQEAALVDYSGLSYTDAFDAMIDKLSKEYAFTEYKGIDWETIQRKYRTFFEEADATNNVQLYYDTLSEIVWSIPDGHVNVSPFGAFRDRFWQRNINGIGIAIGETDDGKVYATFVLPDSPAAQAGIQVGTEIVAMNGRPISDHIARIVPMAETTSTPHNRRLVQLRYATRFPQNLASVDVSFVGLDGNVITRSIPTVQETESFSFTFQEVATTGYELPVEYRLLENENIVLASISDFLDNRALTIQLWERLIRDLNENQPRALIIDMRNNGGGIGFLADQMAAYFFDEPLVVGKRFVYSKDLGEFYSDPRLDDRFYLPAEDLRYRGKVVVLVGPNCASACERFAYAMSLEGRAEIIGHYPTAGLGGGVDDFVMPGGLTIRFTGSRSTNAEGEIHIEGLGVAPTVRVPVTKETLLSDGDPVLEAAIEYLLSN